MAAKYNRPASAFFFRFLKLFAGAIALYLCVAYLLVPETWFWLEPRHPAMESLPMRSVTADDIPGDPINLVVIGSEDVLIRGLLEAGWHSADPITLRSSLRIAEDSILSKPDDDAPVSNLYVWGKKQDLAYEFPVGNNPRQRHHVRFWRSDRLDEQNRPLWVGAATYDRGIGLSHTTGQITHHIGPNIDAERDKVVDDLRRDGVVESVRWINDFQVPPFGRNGGGDPFRTDGRLAVISLIED